MKLMLAGGGTGGHLFPAISIAEEFLDRSPENDVVFVGTKKGIESKILPKLGFNLVFINSSGIVGKGPLNTLRAIFVAGRGVMQALRIIRDYRPNVVLGTGGYVSGPVVLAAWMLRVPTIICEQNSHPGITNRILGRFTDKVLTSFESSNGFFPAGKALTVGNPVRKQILEASKNSANSVAKNSAGFTILVFGGSQGAQRLNELLPAAIAPLAASVKIIHQTGPSYREPVANEYKKLHINADVYDFIYDMGEAYKKADLVVGRSGAGTVAELGVMGLPSVLIPFPFSAHGHQLENARELESEGSAEVIEQHELNADTLSNKLKELLDNNRLKKMSKAAKDSARPSAAAEIVGQIYKIYPEKEPVNHTRTGANNIQG